MEDKAPAEMRPKVRSILGAFLFSGDDVDKKVSVLSGGERARLAMASLMMQPCNLLILDEPTKGIDVATKAAVHQFVSDLAAEGIAIIMVSSELPEILGMSDRIMVMHEGEMTAEFSREEADSDNIIKAATGHRSAAEVS